jgi:hypothetical protein
MSDGITDAEREGREIAEEWKRREINSFLSMRTKKELVDALVNRDNVKTYMIPDKQLWRIECSHNGMYIDDTHHGYGKVRILVVKE